MKAEVDKLQIKKLVNVPSGFKNLKTKVDDLGVEKLKTVPMDLKKLIDLMSKEVVKKTLHSKLNTKVNNLKNKISDAPTLISRNPYHSDKKCLEKKIGDIEYEITIISSLVATNVLNTKIAEVVKRIADTNNEVENKVSDHAKYILLLLNLIYLLAQYLIRN